MGSFSIGITVRVRQSVPVDDLAPQHRWVDEQLARWGRWARERMQRLKCGSIEGQYRSPWRQWHYPSYEELMPAITDAEVRLTDRAVHRVPTQHQLAIKMHYVFMVNPYHICRKVKIHPSVFSAWMHDARSMTLNNMRLLQSKDTS